MKRFLRASASVLSLALSVTALQAATPAERDALFLRLKAAPTNDALALQYARMSVELRDYEAAVSVLERVLDRDPASVDARLQLAQAYFALGSYEVAQYHFTILQRSGALTPQEAQEAAAYRDATREGRQRQSLSGYVEIGAAHLSDLGETGTVGTLSLTHRIDMGGPTRRDWVTGIRIDLAEFGSGTPLGQTSGRITTGPIFSLNGDRFGPTLRPYLSFRAVDDDQVTEDRTSLGLGAVYDNALSANWSIFAGAEGGRITYNIPDVDGNYAEGRIGAVWALSNDTRLRATLFARTHDMDQPAFDSDEAALRLDMAHSFRTRLGPRDWVVSAFVQYDEEEFATTREDETRQIGAALRAYFTQDFYVEPQVQYFDRSSNVAGFEVDETLVSLSVGLEF